ncbi:MAG: hypothetical protein FWG03_05190 [Clostridiales bacterium]|nr:hypothetical protein [Clostridiales bacterium]
MNKQKQFEDSFAEIQAEWVRLCLEYVPDARKIFMYASCEQRTYSFDAFYMIDDEVVMTHKVNTVPGHSYDDSKDRQMDLLVAGTEKIVEMHGLHEEYGREMPTEMKLIYDATGNSLEGEYSYELKYSNTADTTNDDIFDEWFEEVKQKENYL